MSKNIVICLDGTGNQFGEKKSNVVKLFRMLVRDPDEQVAYYDPGVGTMGDPTYKTWIARKTNKVLGLAFGRGLSKNLVEAYTYLMNHYEDGDKVFIFGFSRGAYTARALAGFIKVCGLFENGAENLIPYAMGLYLKKTPKSDPEKFYKVLSGFRSTYGRNFPIDQDPKNPGRKVKPGRKPHHNQLRIHFLGLFDTVKSYGWVRKPIVLRNDSENPSVLTVRHALAVDERRIFFRQSHWKTTAKQDSKEVWFPGVHSDVGGGYPEQDSALAKVALEWIVEEACEAGLIVDPYRYAEALVQRRDSRYSGPDPLAKINVSLKGAWKLIQSLPKKKKSWEDFEKRRTVKGEAARDPNNNHAKKLLLHQSVIDRKKHAHDYAPPNFPSEEFETVQTRDTVYGVSVTDVEEGLAAKGLVPYIIRFNSDEANVVEECVGKLIDTLADDRKLRTLGKVGIDETLEYGSRPYSRDSRIGIADKATLQDTFTSIRENFEKLINNLEELGGLLRRQLGDEEIPSGLKDIKLEFQPFDLSQRSSDAITPDFPTPWARRRAVTGMMLVLAGRLPL